MRKTTNIVLLSLVLFAACSTDSDELTQQPPQKKSYPLTIEVTEKPLIQDGEEGSGSNRAAITTTSSLTAFKLDYVYNTSSTGSTSAVRDEVSGKWKDNGSAGWPDPDATVNWYAYTDGTFNLNGGTPYINFTVDELASNQKDLLVATASGTYTGTDGKLSFSFDHACSALRFYVKKSTNLNDHTVSITSLKICNIVKQGNYSYSSESWTPSSTRTEWTLYSGSAITLGSGAGDYQLLNGSADDSYLFMIPQTLTPWDHITAIASATTQSYLELTCSIDGAASQNAYIPFGTSFVKGKKCDVKINIGKNSLYSGPDTKVITE